MTYAAFSEKQRLALTWWMPGSGESHREAIVCDGAVRSGKTIFLTYPFRLFDAPQLVRFLMQMIQRAEEKDNIEGFTVIPA